MQCIAAGSGETTQNGADTRRPKNCSKKNFILKFVTMAKVKTRFYCQNCGGESAKWVGKCPSCEEWNTFVEEVVQKPTSNKISTTGLSTDHGPVKINEVSAKEQPRLITTDLELNRVLGGGIVPGSIVLIGGEPGIGKSTLMLQIAIQLTGKKIAYVSGEESEQQIKMRADRVGVTNDDCYLLTETSTDKILKYFHKLKPDICVIDSIQTLRSPFIESTAGSVSQIRECASEMQRFAKEKNIPVFLIGHITKDGSIAGPKILEHIVDTVLQFEGDRHHTYRLLRTIKNRFGSASEIGIYEMQQNGLRQVNNPSELLITQNENKLSGICIAATMEGLRPLLIETQALVSKAVFGTPQRSTTGFDLRRLHMLLAVLEKRCGFRLADKDIFINIAGGLKVEDPAIDLAIISSLLSSLEDIHIPTETCFAGEVGLSGEVRTINRIEQRIIEAQKLGFERIFISGNTKGIKQKNFDIELSIVNTVEELYKTLF